MARTRSENYDEIQRGILTTACGLFARQGYMRASIADLADACKLSRGALYHYFDSKEAILFAILDAHIREMIADVEAAMAGKAATLEQFRAAIHAIVALNARSSDEQRVILNDLSFLGETEQDAIKALERQLVDTVSDLLVELDKEGKIVKRTKKIYSMMLFGILNFSHTWYDPKGGVDPGEFADMVVDLFLYGFTMPVPAKDAARPLRQRA
ncbi:MULTISPECIES: TetR/AcrR family transcriptional regulator [unclassified Bradyrhizobium]|uniref:TetR/AcrR family transcriptional regulator n=1 Tax=unclassified Bradyrhizobium TaxID=2631580 RepID=UPI001BA5AE66|nr:MULTISPECIES: TetR/AcrR family transcriptional regulator [unclassified Bradyrhizobium]MBR1201723.1 TetR family transcriptional regulator [Bradyrhizobium sp. AUGA SZCCT0124]MBR1311708.1 TetR family transcriptional regulator [Bradyrhizobium sp. AUGA SZCCT0051]MBR1338672.1 TetR family transcriptional regulator [Bradyrhizobium sp. AUGA SZCCT0105]MBR1353246.1 TetR family transcriptional regulator [Bradyrhizobium sp. AUGA SZCCT0045]